MTYKWDTPEEVEAVIPMLKENGVSVIAQSRDGFIPAYLRHRSPTKMETVMAPRERVTWAQKRELFIRRTLAAYKINPTYRRALSLMAWAYTPRDYKYASG
jgi:hypothetical protein